MKKYNLKIVFILLLGTIFTSTFSKIEERKLEKMKNFYHNLPVLVTGGAGFIGSHIVEKLVEVGAKVTVLDDLSSGNIENLDNVKDKIIFIKKSITNFETCLEATKGKYIIFHLAAMISVPESIKNPLSCHRVNIEGVFNILEAARINKAERFIFSSSAAVYGPTNLTCKEEMTCNPQSPYGTSKLIGELYCKQYSNNFGIKTAILRYFNVFGNRQNPNGAYAAVVAKFKDQMKKNLPITIFGDGLQTRDFIPVEDVAEANLTIAMLKKEQMNGQTYNIATGKSMNLLQLIEVLKKEFPHYSGNIIFKPTRAGDIKHSSADGSKYQTITI